MNETDPNVLAYLRRYKHEAILVVLNMSGMQQTVDFDLTPQGRDPVWRSGASQEICNSMKWRVMAD